MNKVMRNALKLVAIFVIYCHAINVSAQKSAFDRYIESFDGFIDSLLTANRVIFAEIRDSVYNINPEFRDKDFVLWGDHAGAGYVLIACDSAFTTYSITRESDKWHFVKIDPFDKERFRSRKTPGEVSDFKNNPPNKLSFPDSLPKYIDESVHTEGLPFYFALYKADGTFVDFTSPPMPDFAIIPLNLYAYMIQVWLTRDYTVKASKKKRKKRR